MSHPLIPLSFTPSQTSPNRSPGTSHNTSPEQSNNSVTASSSNRNSQDSLPNSNLNRVGNRLNSKKVAVSAGPGITISPGKAGKRNISAHLRGSRTASLIIPVASTQTEPVETDDFVDMTLTNNNTGESSENDEVTELNTPSSPTLPQRPPQTPPRRFTSGGFEPEKIETYGMQRIEAPLFSPTSVKSSKTRASMELNDGIELNKPLSAKASFQNINERYLIQLRRSQVDNSLESFGTAGLTISKNEYFEKLHSSNSYIEVLSEIRSGSFKTADIPTMYSLLLNSLKIKGDTFQTVNNIDSQDLGKFDSIMENLSFLLRSTDSQKTQFKNDLIKIYTILAQLQKALLEKSDTTYESPGPIQPNPLIFAFVYRCASKNILPQALVVASMVEACIMGSHSDSKEFQFLLLRSIEAVEPALLLKKNGEVKNPVVYVNEFLHSEKFWCDLVHQLFLNDTTSKTHPLGLTNVLHLLVVQGVQSLIKVIVSLRHELGIFGCKKSESASTDLAQNIDVDLVRFHREYILITESAKSQLTSETLEKLSYRNQELESILQEHHKAYNTLLYNYQQLNEEKMSVASLSLKAQSENDTLNAQKRSLAAQVEQSLGQYEVIKQTLEKNRRVKELNESMRKEVERLEKENARLSRL